MFEQKINGNMRLVYIVVIIAFITTANFHYIRKVTSIHKEELKEIRSYKTNLDGMVDSLINVIDSLENINKTFVKRGKNKSNLKSNNTAKPKDIETKPVVPDSNIVLKDKRNNIELKDIKREFINLKLCNEGYDDNNIPQIEFEPVYKTSNYKKIRIPMLRRIISF